MLSYHSIRHRQLRAWLTLIGIIIGIAAIISLITLTQGMQYAIEAQFSNFGSDVIRISPKGLRGPPTGADYLTTKDVDTVKSIPGIEYVAPLYMDSTAVEYKNTKLFHLISGYESDLVEKGFEDMDMKLSEGRLFSSTEKYSVIIGAKVADEFDETTIPLHSSLLIKDTKFKVVGIIESAGNPQSDQIIYAPLDSVREIFSKPDGVSVITAKVLDGMDPVEIGDKIFRKLKKERDNENFEVFTPVQLIAQINSILGIIQFILVGIAAISLAVGGIGIMNSMYTSVLERTRQIGIMKAVGARNSHILILFLIESGFIGVVGGIAGIIIGYAMSYSVQLIAGQLGFALLSIQLSPQLILFALLFAFIIGSASGILPAYQASKLKPVDALRYE